jgi:hypothetical protein
MHSKFQGLRDDIDCNREALAAVGRQLRSIYDADISRPLPGRFARLLNELGQTRDGSADPKLPPLVRIWNT